MGQYTKCYQQQAVERMTHWTGDVAAGPDTYSIAESFPLFMRYFPFWTHFAAC